MGDAARRKKHALKNGLPWPPVQGDLSASAEPPPDLSLEADKKGGKLIIPGTAAALMAQLDARRAPRRR